MVTYAYAIGLTILNTLKQRSSGFVIVEERFFTSGRTKGILRLYSCDTPFQHVPDHRIDASPFGIAKKRRLVHYVPIPKCGEYPRQLGTLKTIRQSFIRKYVGKPLLWRRDMRHNSVHRTLRRFLYNKYHPVVRISEEIIRRRIKHNVADMQFSQKLKYKWRIVSLNHDEQYIPHDKMIEKIIKPVQLKQSVVHPSISPCHLAEDL